MTTYSFLKVKLKGSKSWKWSKSHTFNSYNSSINCFSVPVCIVFACQVTLKSVWHGLNLDFFPLFLLLCCVWKMMQCHVDACDDMQPPELVSVLNLFLKTALLNRLSDNGNFLVSSVVSGDLHIFKIIKLSFRLSIYWQFVLTVWPVQAGNVNRYVEVCSSTAKRGTFMYLFLPFTPRFHFVNSNFLRNWCTADAHI